MLKIRVVKTASKAQAVQLVYYKDSKRVVYKHIGSAHTEEELKALKAIAQDFLARHTPVLPLFKEDASKHLIHLDKCEFRGVYYSFFHQIFGQLIGAMGFSATKQQLLFDLVVMRIFEPASKLRSIELLKDYFGIHHHRQRFYGIAPGWLSLKDEFEQKIVSFARRQYQFDYNLVFYDVTTLYFEAFEEDELRKNGFSKDSKSQQPQILIGLLVSKEGFPIGYEVFAGNTFEGHTILPVIKRFIQKDKAEKLTVVADAAMISDENVKELEANNLRYIVGARIRSLSDRITMAIVKSMDRIDGEIVRISTDKGFLICDFSSARYRKDRYELEKQIKRAQEIVSRPSRQKRAKFVQEKGGKIGLNEALIEKNRHLLGIKGYFTNLKEDEVSNTAIIGRYHELYRVEQAFRISKNDLEMRPIFHFKEEPIKLHILICFISLALSKHVELQTGVSIKKFVYEAKKVTDARIFNKITQEEYRMRTSLPQAMKDYLRKLKLPH